MERRITGACAFRRSRKQLGVQLLQAAEFLARFFQFSLALQGHGKTSTMTYVTYSLTKSRISSRNLAPKVFSLMSPTPGTARMAMGVVGLARASSRRVRSSNTTYGGFRISAGIWP